MTTVQGKVVKINTVAGTTPQLTLREDGSGTDICVNVPEEFILEMDVLPIGRYVQLKLIRGAVQSLKLLD